jgi:tricorn protease
LFLKTADTYIKFDTRTKKYEKVPVTISSDFANARAEWKDVSGSVRSADMSPNGERLVFSARGEIFNVPAKNGITRNLTREPGVHARDARWSPNGEYIAWVSDKSGEFEIYMQRHDGSQPPVQLTNDGDTYIFGFEWSPDSRKILYHDKKHRLRIVDVAHQGDNPGGLVRIAAHVRLQLVTRQPLDSIPVPSRT